MIVGGGVIGFVVAREAAARGRTVAVLERTAPARESSWAAAGMLSPLGEAEGAGPFLSLALRSAELYPAFVSDLVSESGIDPGLRHPGKLMVALDGAAATELERRRAWQEAQGFDSRWLDVGQLRALEPDVAGDAVGALFLPGEGLIDPRALGQAAFRAAHRRGVRLLTGHGADGLLVQAGRARGVRLRGGGVICADTVVVAAGAWSGRLSGLPRPLPVRPVRGQMLALRGGASIGHTIVGAGGYLLPRGDDESPQVWVGATMEEAGFEKTPTAAARATLMESAARLVPGLTGSTLLEHWSGLRPGTPDGLPVLGPDPDVSGLLYATGHFRNGILLAPITALLLGRVLDGDLSPDLLPFRPERFAADIGA